jgi:hypothetical protein
LMICRRAFLTPIWFTRARVSTTKR